MTAVRDARAGDLDAVAAIEAASPQAPGWTRAQFAAELGRTDRVFLAAEGGSGVCGYAVAWLVGGEAQLLTISVRAAERRRGAARALMTMLCDRARAAGCAKVTLEVAESNAPARALYAGLGGRVVGRRPKFYNDGSDALLMDLPL
ncbi:MAG: ribosomal protein S18-alanine N-acetyltransferase [Elusimicrobia bacterium]|nr:ribosomal protein S18-alanine N-acetyltransferase [Elusimicrobiota bacterium]